MWRGVGDHDAARMHRVTIAVVTGLAACGAHVESRFIATAPAQPAKAPTAVAVFLSQRPTIPYVELGLIDVGQSDADPWKDHLRDEIDRLRIEGSLHGCDAVIANPPTLHASRWEITATCVAYR
jgi:hypothetical protein